MHCLNWLAIDRRQRVDWRDCFHAVAAMTTRPNFGAEIGLGIQPVISLTWDKIKVLTGSVLQCYLFIYYIILLLCLLSAEFSWSYYLDNVDLCYLCTYFVPTSMNAALFLTRVLMRNSSVSQQVLLSSPMLWEAVFLFLFRWLNPLQLLDPLELGWLGMKEQSQGLVLPCLYLYHHSIHLLKEIRSHLCQSHLLFHLVLIHPFWQANNNSLINKILHQSNSTNLSKCPPCRCHHQTCLSCSLLRICLCCHILIYLVLHLQCRAQCLVQWYENMAPFLLLYYIISLNCPWWTLLPF